MAFDIEIKFRGKRVDNGEWVYGLPVNYCNKTYILVLTDFEEERVYEQYPHKEMWPYEIIPETVGQYTGLNDKKEKEIYKRDIVKANDYVGIVKYGEFDIYKMIREQSDEAAELLNFTSGYGWYIAFQDGTDYLFDNNTEEWLEVIGNIYENPELLEKIE